jgi:hypothetical protein
MKTATPWLIGAILLILSFCIQIFLLNRYINQEPKDIVGILLFTITAISFAIAAFGFTLQWKKLKTQVK